MKYFKLTYIILFCSAVGLLLGGCMDFLNIVPDERPTEEDAFQDRFAAEGYLYSVYAPMPNNRTAWSIDLLTADEVVTAFEHESWAQFPKGQYTASNPVISYWASLYKGIRQAYILINNVDSTPGLSESLKTEYKAEARFLIGYYHFLLARMYGPVIIQDGVADVEMSYDEYPARATYEETINFIAGMLDEAARDLPATRNGTEYGRATSVIAKAIKARMFLYAASPLFNGGGSSKSSFYEDFTNKDGTQLIPTQYDKEKWKRAADAAKEAIDAAEDVGHKLYYEEASVNAELPSDPVEKRLRFTFMDQDSKEIIWAETRREGIYDFQNKSTPFIGGTSWNGISPTLTILEAFYTENGLPIDKDPQYDYQGRYTVKQGPNGNTLALNLNREPRFNAWINYHNDYYEIKRSDKKEIICKYRKYDNCGINNRSNNYSPTGYLNKKGVHPQLNQSSLQVSEHYPWPRIQLVELYLNYAEALIEYGEDFATAKEYIDKVRQRAGIPTIDQAWGPIGGADDQETLREIVRQERTIEFYLENMRFWDQRRWMTAEPYFDTKAKGMNIQGETDAGFFQVTEVQFPREFRSPAHYLMPIPQGEINKNPKLVQNPGY